MRRTFGPVLKERTEKMTQACADDARGLADENDPETLRVLVAASQIFTTARMVYEIPFRELSGPDFSWRAVAEYALKPADLKGVNILILYRCVQGSTLSLARLARLTGIKVIYELDDDLLDPPGDESWGKRYRIGHLSEIIKMFLTQVDLVKAGSPELARRLKQRDYPVVYQPYAAKVCEGSPEATGPPCRIGYFGSPHHQNDIEMIFPALLALKERWHEQVEFEFIGCYPQEWPRLKARIFPVETDYEMFLELLTERRWTLGLAPLRRTSFNEAKSNSKFRDLTAAGILGVYTDLPPYRDSVIHNENGWLVRDSSEAWYDMLQNALSSTEHATMLKQAGKLLQTVHSPKAVAGNWLALLKELNHT
jgi:glycosyltransferase involved in cell wall biosynthesis